MYQKLIVITLFTILFGLNINVNSQNLQWAKRMGGTDFEMGSSVTVDLSGNIYTTGDFDGTADFDPGTGVLNLITNGYQDIFVQKLNASGNFEWAVNLGGTGSDEGLSIIAESSGNIYVTGFFTGTADFDPGPGTFNLTAASMDIFILKLNTSGNFIWAKKMGGTPNVSENTGLSITVDVSGNLYTTGYFDGVTDFDPGSGVYNLTGLGMAGSGDHDTFIQKLDSSGNFLWAKHLGGIGDDHGVSIITDANGYVYTTGFFSGTADFDPGTGTYNLISAGSVDIFISKLDSTGNFQWAKQIGGANAQRTSSLVVDTNGNVITTGYFLGTADFDPGTLTYNMTSAGDYDIFISKLDSNGNFLWAKQIGGTDSESPSSIAMDATGSLYILGAFTTTVDFDPGSGVYNLFSMGNSDVFVSKLDAFGNFIWAIQLGGIDIDAGTEITIDQIGNIYLTGLFYDTADFDPGLGINNLTSAGDADIFVVKLGNITGMQESNNSGSNRITIFPNPTTNNFTITFPNTINKGVIEIYNVLGENIFTEEVINVSQKEVQLKNMEAGIYFVKVREGEKEYSKKLVIK